jgi:predicted RNase H-like HicB family nuclease
VENSLNVFTTGDTWDKAIENSKAANAATIEQCLAEAGNSFCFHYSL